MSVADSIASALQRFGRPMTLRRITTGPRSIEVFLDVQVFGRKKNEDPVELDSDVSQFRNEITISNAEIAAAQWPGPPMRLDQIIADGRTRTIDSAEPKYLGTEVLVYVCQVVG